MEKLDLLGFREEDAGELDHLARGEPLETIGEGVSYPLASLAGFLGVHGVDRRKRASVRSELSMGRGEL